jgi:hypothetical protein
MVENTRIPRASVNRIEAHGVTVFYREAGPTEGLAGLFSSVPSTGKSFAAAAEHHK